MTRKGLSPAEVADITGLAPSTIRRLCGKQLKARKLGRDWLIDPDSARAYAERERKPGRPRKETT